MVANFTYLLYDNVKLEIHHILAVNDLCNSISTCIPTLSSAYIDNYNDDDDDRMVHMISTDHSYLESLFFYTKSSHSKFKDNC